MRFFNKGPLEVARRYLDIRDRLATDADDSIRLNFELRPLLVWEEFAAGIIRWSLTVSDGPFVGAFSGLQITINGAPPNFSADTPVPPGSLIVFDEVNNLGANAVRLFIGSDSTGLISARPADYTDARWGPDVAVPPVRAVGGSNAALTGQRIGSVISLGRFQKPGFFIGEAQKVAEPLGGDHCLTIWSNAINQQFDLEVYGRIILARQ